jgi:hypothetical protein
MVGVVDHPGGQPQDLLLDLGQETELLPRLSRGILATDQT